MAEPQISPVNEKIFLNILAYFHFWKKVLIFSLIKVMQLCPTFNGFTSYGIINLYNWKYILITDFLHS